MHSDRPQNLEVGSSLLFPFFDRSYLFVFAVLSCSSPLSSLCLRCTTSDEVATLTHTHVIWDSRTRVPTNRSDDFGKFFFEQKGTGPLSLTLLYCN